MPEMTARHLLTLFGRAATQEQYAQVRIDSADFIERETEARLAELRRRWRQLESFRRYNSGWKP